MRTPFSNLSFWSLVWDLRRALFSEPLETWKPHGRTPYSRAIWGHGICTPDIINLISEMSNIIDILQRKVGILTHKAIGMPDIRSGSTVKNAMKMLFFFGASSTLALSPTWIHPQPIAFAANVAPLLISPNPKISLGSDECGWMNRKLISGQISE